MISRWWMHEVDPAWRWLWSLRRWSLFQEESGQVRSAECRMSWKETVSVCFSFFFFSFLVGGGVMRCSRMQQNICETVNMITVVAQSLRPDSDAHSTTSSASPAQSPSYSNQSDEGSDSELAPGSVRSPVFSFLDLTYWRRCADQDRHTCVYRIILICWFSATWYIIPLKKQHALDVSRRTVDDF